MAASRRRGKLNLDPVAAELYDIKRLLVLQLIASGVQAKDIASTLGVTKSHVSGLVPARKVKKRSP